ncbi:hypothetical protein FEP90_04900 [Burkholderia multivorans]|nr:hypothetical protein [Burkholderia multivorans]
MFVFVTRCALTVKSALPPAVPPSLSIVTAERVVAPSPALVSVPERFTMLAADTSIVPCAPFADMMPCSFDSTPPVDTVRFPPDCVLPNEFT